MTTQGLNTEKSNGSAEVNYMFESIILFIILAVIWVMIMFNRSLKRQIRKNARNIEQWSVNTESGWGADNCTCGAPRNKWKALSMLRPENILLLECSQCGSLWEEKMSVYGNKWRQVKPEYAAEQFHYNVKSCSKADTISR